MNIFSGATTLNLESMSVHPSVCQQKYDLLKSDMTMGV